MAINSNSLLLFGEHGTEVIKLSQLYDPTKAKYQHVAAGKAYDSSKTYFLPEFKLKVISFKEVTTVNKNASGILQQDYWYYDPEKDDSQNGNYVPAEQSLVVVDTTDAVWGNYTILVVDAVDPVTYKSTLVPVNFSGNIDDASRVIDYNNNSMMLYIEDVAGGGQRLLPDRKLMMYGPNTMQYVISKKIDGVDTIITTNSQETTRKDKEEFVDYVTADGCINSSKIQVANVEVFKTLAGKTVSYYDAANVKQTITVVVTTSGSGALTVGSTSESQFNALHAAYLAGREVQIASDSMSTLNNIYVPRSCYLRSSITALVTGEVVDFMAYETARKDDGTIGTPRLVFAAKVTVKGGTSSYTVSATSKVITGFGVKLNGLDTTDLWQIKKGNTKSSLTLTPYLTYDDGSMSEIADTDNCYHEYGFDQLTTDAAVGTEFDVLFKYFPNRAHGVTSNQAYDARYVAVGLIATDTEIVDGYTVNKRLPDADKQYFTKSGTNFVLVNGNGHLDRFLAGTTYYVVSEKFAWDATVARPTRDMLVCRKRIRIIATESNSLHKITMIPIWDKNAEKWDYRFLVYRADWARPRLLTTAESDYGSVAISGTLPSLPATADGTRNNTTYNLTLYFNPGTADPNAVTDSRIIAMQLQHWTRYLTTKERWLFGFSHSSGSGLNAADSKAYGLDNASLAVARRPYINCKIMSDTSGGSYGKFWIPVDQASGFPVMLSGTTSINYFLRNFYERYISEGDADTSWLARETAEGTEQITPNYFIVRSATESDVCTRAMPIKTDTNAMAYGDEFTCVGLPIPETNRDEIVVVEFLYFDGSSYQYLFGVPVEVRLVS